MLSGKRKKSPDIRKQEVEFCSSDVNELVSFVVFTLDEQLEH